MKRAQLILSVLLLTLLVGPASVQAQAGITFDWWTVDNGGTTALIGGSYQLNGTIGQPDAGELVAAEYTLIGGVWGNSFTEHAVYLSILTRN